MAHIDEFVKVANKDMEYPVHINQSTIDIEKIANRKDFKSKHFALAETACSVSTTITLTLLFFIWIYFEIKEADA